MIEDIIIYNKLHKLIENEQYRLSYGSASFGAKTRRAISNFAKPYLDQYWLVAVNFCTQMQIIILFIAGVIKT
jgi:hypothetical protein